MTDQLTPWPENMVQSEPWAHQHEAYDVLGKLWQTRDGVALFSDMGTGKSLVALALWKAYGFERVLIISGAKNMVPEWVTMAAEENLPVVELSGSVPSRVETLRTRWYSVEGPLGFVTNVEAIWREPMASALLKLPWDAVFIDESQKIKAAGSKVSRFASRLGDRVGYRLIMTGTPMHDKPLDVYGQYRFLDKSIFGTSYDAFLDRYAKRRPLQNGAYQITGYQNEDELSAKVFEVAYRVDSSVLNLPEVIPSTRSVRLTSKTRKLYDDFKKTSVAEIGDRYVLADNALTLMLRLQQITSGYLPTKSLADEEDADQVETPVDSSKFESFVALLDELPREKIVVFANFKHDLDRIAEAADLDGRDYYELSGRANQWHAWRDATDDPTAVLAVQYKSGSAGINLTAARYAVFYSYPLSLGDYQQALKRINRPGQQKTAYTYALEAVNSIDVKLGKALRAKEEITTALLDTDAGSLRRAETD